MTLFEHQTFHSLKLSLDKKYEITGLTLRYRLKNWEKIQYMAIGFNLDDEFFHIKISHPTEELANIYCFQRFNFPNPE